MFSAKPLVFLAQMKEMTSMFSRDSGRILCVTAEEEEEEEEEEKELSPTFALAAKRFRAFDLSCRVCGAGAGCWAWIPG